MCIKKNKGPAVSHLWAQNIAKAEPKGPTKLMDACIGAIAQHYELVLVTRNTADFEAFNIQIFNPWHHN